MADNDLDPNDIAYVHPGDRRAPQPDIATAPERQWEGFTKWHDKTYDQPLWDTENCKRYVKRAVERAITFAARADLVATPAPLVAGEGRPCPHLRQSVGDPVASQCLDCGASLRKRGCPTCGADLTNCPECKTRYFDGSGMCLTCDTFTGPSDLGLRRAAELEAAPTSSKSDEETARRLVLSIAVLLNAGSYPPENDEIAVGRVVAALASNRNALVDRVKAKLRDIGALGSPDDPKTHAGEIITELEDLK